MGVFGLLLTLGLLGYLLYQEATGNPGPPEILVEVKEVQASGEDFLVIVEARNLGGETAADVLIEGELRVDGEPAEVSQVNFNYIPVGSSREAGLFFSRDPALHTLSLRALGYRRP